MDLSSLLFFIFLLIFLVFYFLFPQKTRALPIIIGSCLFLITYDLGLLIFLAFYILINYFFVLSFSFLKHRLLRNLALFLSISVNLSVLASFKYLPFIQKNIAYLSSLVQLSLSLPNLIIPILPVGISFLTFKAISLLIDSYKNKTRDLNLGNFSAYLIFFPEFISGPIDRFSNFLESLRNQSTFSSNNFFSGTYRFLIGLFKKLIIANNLALLINPVYDNPLLFKNSSLLITTYIFSIQIFFDFSGYSDMAIGIGKMLGFSIPENFSQPYLSTSIKDFWQRWHITLSSWFKDYLYIPLGGNQKGQFRQILNLLIVFLITGFWHGASWNFIFWGFLHGLYRILSLLIPPISFIEKQKPKIKNLFKIFLTFNLVNFAWIFFRAKSLKNAFSFVKLIIKPKPTGDILNLPFLVTPFLLTLILCLLVYLSKQKQNTFLRILPSIFIIFSLLFFSPSEPQDFLYFKF